MEAMADPAVYGQAASAVEVVETHISRVFLAGDRAFKVRKPVRTSFLDYRSLESRLQMSREEVRLGRRLAPSIYLGVRSIVAGPEGYRLAGEHEPDACDYAVEMRRFDPSGTLSAMLERGDADRALVHRIGGEIAAFHRRQPPLVGHWMPPAVGAAVHGNFDDLLGSTGVEPSRLRAAQVFATAFLHRHADLIAERSAGGHARDGHGDLRADHVVVEGDAIDVFDPLEFSAELRVTDVAADLAFLVMDLHRAGRGDLAKSLITGYRAAGGDCGPDRLLSFYAAYRGWVRAKVATSRAHQLDADHDARRLALEEAARYVSAAERLAWAARLPSVIVVCGTAATGKSTVAASLAARSGLPHLNSDVVRKEMTGIASGERAPAAAYSDDFNRRTYTELGREARRNVRDAGGAIIDATFRFRVDRDAFRDGLGPDRSAIFVECIAPSDVIRARAEGRARQGERISDADAAIALRQCREFEPLDEVAARDHIMLRADRPVGELSLKVEEALDLAAG